MSLTGSSRIILLIFLLLIIIFLIVILLLLLLDSGREPPALSGSIRAAPKPASDGTARQRRPPQAPDRIGAIVKSTLSYMSFGASNSKKWRLTADLALQDAARGSRAPWT